MNTDNQQNYVGIVLLIEDDYMLTKLYEEKFSIEGFKILIARDGESGLKIAEEEAIDIMLLDLGLPRMSGLEVLKKFKSTEKGIATPVVVLTNTVDPEEKKEALRRGSLDYLVKA